MVGHEMTLINRIYIQTPKTKTCKTLTMKNKYLKSGFLSVAFITAIFSSSVSAQTNANTTLNVVLSDVRSIKVNPAQTNVSLAFANANDYTNGVSSNQPSHLEIISTGGYAIKVKSSGPSLVNGTNSIPVNTITLTPTVGAQPGVSGSVIVISVGGNTNGSSGGSGTLTPAVLNPTPVNLISSSSGTTKRFYDITYKASGGAPYINKAAGTYSTTITYSIEPL